MSETLAPPALRFEDPMPEGLAEDAAALEALPFGAVLLDRACRVLRANAAVARLFGRPAQGMLGCRFFDEIAPSAKATPLYAACITAAPGAECTHLLDYRMPATRVRMRVAADPAGGAVWLLLKRL